jgi:hypothetical protein
MSPKKTETAKKTDQSRPTSKGQKLPILWETVNTFSRIIVTLLGVAVAVISFFSGSGYLMSAIRAGVAMLGVGFILWLIYWMIVKGSIKMMRDLVIKQENQKNQNSSMEYKV